MNHRPPPRRDRRNPRHRSARPPAERSEGPLFIYGMHPVQAALGNPRRIVRRVIATANALARLAETGARLPAGVTAEEVEPRDLDRLLGGEAVHQGVALEVEPLAPAAIESLEGARLVVVLDQVTDPHNVGAILRSALAFGADALLTTARHAPAETGVLAKAASGALDRLPVVTIANLHRALDQLGDMGFIRLGLDSEAPEPIEATLNGDRYALVLGAEGKGMRRLTRETCDRLARLPTAGPLASLNVSNAAAVALYVVRRHLDESGAA
ncbi:MAG: RNA methyltransferase [Bauldia sp.]|nr:RNA methyltransferase [Bauldia sp.]